MSLPTSSHTFLQANHSARFYEELARYMPDYKQRERILK